MTVRKTKDTMTPSLERLNRQIPKIVDEAYKHFVRITPRRSGNARTLDYLKRHKKRLLRK